MPMKIGDRFPGFEGATDWFNGLREEAVEHVEGRPTLVYFWATSCGICKKQFPKLKELAEKYTELRTVAVHMPRQQADTDLERVSETIREHGIADICAVDNRHELKKAFLNEQGWVPVYYLFDADGRLKSRSAGEFGVSMLSKALERMFAQKTDHAAA